MNNLNSVNGQHGGIDDLDLLGSEIMENYANVMVKEHCLKATHNQMGIEFIECVNRSGFLINKYFSKIIKIDEEMSLQEEEELIGNDPSVFKGGPNQ